MENKETKKEEVKRNDIQRDPPIDKCDKNNPKDPHYPDRDQGDYNSSCVWIWDIGFAPEEQGK